MQAKRAEILVWSCADLEAEPSRVGKVGAATRVVSASPTEPKAPGPVIKDDGTAVQQIIEFLVQKKAL